MSTAATKTIVLLLDGIQVGTGRLWKGIVIDYVVRWNKDPDLAQSRRATGT